MLRALASALNAVVSEVFVIGVVVAAVVLIARESRGAGPPALESGDAATAMLASAYPLSDYDVELHLEPPVVEIPTDYESRRTYRTPDLDRQAPRGKPGWIGEWL